MSLRQEGKNIRRFVKAIRAAVEAGDEAAALEGLEIACDFLDTLGAVIPKPFILLADAMDGDLDMFDDIEERADTFTKTWEG